MPNSCYRCFFQVQRYQPEPEQLEAVQLRGVKLEEQRDASRFASPPPDWATGDVKLGEPKGRVQQREQIEREVDVPARDQIKLRGAKPKPAEQPEPAAHVQIEEERARLRAVQQGPEPEKEKIVPHREQANIRQKYQPKAARAGEHVTLDAGSLKDTPSVVKTYVDAACRHQK